MVKKLILMFAAAGVALTVKADGLATPPSQIPEPPIASNVQTSAQPEKNAQSQAPEQPAIELEPVIVSSPAPKFARSPGFNGCP